MKLSIQNRINYIIGKITPLFGVIAFISLLLKYGFHLSEGMIVNLLILDEIIAAF